MIAKVQVKRQKEKVLENMIGTIFPFYFYLLPCFLP